MHGGKGWEGSERTHGATDAFVRPDAQGNLRGVPGQGGSSSNLDFGVLITDSVSEAGQAYAPSGVALGVLLFSCLVLPTLLLLHLRPSILQRHGAVEYGLAGLRVRIDAEISQALELITGADGGIG